MVDGFRGACILSWIMEREQRDATAELACLKQCMIKLMQEMMCVIVWSAPLSLLVLPGGVLTGGMLQMVESGTFGEFWDTIGLIVNGNIFFFSGASAINFFWRSTEASSDPETSKSCPPLTKTETANWPPCPVTITMP